MRTVLILIFAAVFAGAVAGQENSLPKKKVAVYVKSAFDDSIKKVIGSKLALAIIKNGKYSAMEMTDAIIEMSQNAQNREH